MYVLAKAAVVIILHYISIKSTHVYFKLTQCLCQLYLNKSGIDKEGNIFKV